MRTYGTREDFLIPSACLNSTVSGLVSRTVLSADLIGPGRLPRREVLPRAAPAPTSPRPSSTPSPPASTRSPPRSTRDGRSSLAADRTATWAGWAAVERISEEYGIHDVNLVKPGVGETTRVLLRRVPWKILAPSAAPGADLDHVRLLAEQRGVPVERSTTCRTAASA